MIKVGRQRRKRVREVEGQTTRERFLAEAEGADPAMSVSTSSGRRGTHEEERSQKRLLGGMARCCLSLSFGMGRDGGEKLA